MCFVKIYFFMFNVMCVMSNEVSFMKCWMQCFIIFYKSMSKIVMDCVCLIVRIIIFYSDVNVKFFSYFNKFKWLMNNYVFCFMIKVFVKSVLVYFNVICVWMQEYMSSRIFVVVCVVVLSICYVNSFLNV